MGVSDKRRVVVTGIGVISPIGTGVEEFWKAVVEGRSGVTRITQFDPSEFPTQVAAEVKDFDPAPYMDRKDARRMDRFAQFAVAATRMSLDDADYQIPAAEADRVGVLIGSGIGGIKTLEDQCNTLLSKGPSRISPFFIPMMIPDMASGQVSIIFGAKGHNACSVTACASGSTSIGDAYSVIARGDADVMITGGTEAGVTRLAMGGFCAAKTMTTRNDDPQRASRPFDRERDGFVLGEGAGILILESLDHALERGARIRAEMIGYAMTADGYHITAPAPDGEGAATAMSKAIDDAGCTPDDIDYINAHGTSTQLNDAGETAAIKRVFGERAYSVAVSSTKSMIGHLLGAAGGVEAITTILALERGLIPPTINYEFSDPNCDLDYVPNELRRADLRVAISNSFGFGGHNAVLVFRKI